MPSLKDFRIEFDRLRATYMAGETVSGNITINVAREKAVRGVHFSTKGEARVQWTESKKSKGMIGNQHRLTVAYNNSEEYYNIAYNIIGNSTAESRVKIPAGEHVYPFSFTLPYNIPSSFEHRHAYIRYTVKVVIDRPWKFDHECKAAFTVVSALDLNAYQHKCVGVDDEVTESFCCFCCINRGGLNLRVRMPVSGYVPGQSINVILDYKNFSNSVQITKITTKLLRRLKLYASGVIRKMKIEAFEITSTKNFGPFSRNGQLETSLLIPPVPPSNLEYCSIVDLEYKLVIFVHVSGPHCTIERHYPILIGTVPLNFPPSAPLMEPTSSVPTVESTEYSKDPATMTVSMPMQMPVHDAPHPLTNQPTGDPPQPATSSNTGNIPPPSYEECVYGTGNIRDHDESNYMFGVNEPFVPRYPVFNCPTPSIPNN